MRPAWKTRIKNTCPLLPLLLSSPPALRTVSNKADILPHSLNIAGLTCHIFGRCWLSIYSMYVQYSARCEGCPLLFSHQVVSYSSRPHGLQHARLLCPSPTSSSNTNLLKPMSIESVMPSNHLILCRPLLLLPSIFPSIRVFSNESVLRIRWPKYWSFSFSINSSTEYSGLIFFKIDWFDFLAFQGTLKSLLQHHNQKASVLRHSAFFTI